MLREPTPTKRVGFGLRAFIAFEVALFSGTYYVYHRMNTSVEYRLYMSENWPRILDGFYMVGEKLGNQDTRQKDKEYWELIKVRKV